MVSVASKMLDQLPMQIKMVPRPAEMLEDDDVDSAKEEEDEEPQGAQPDKEEEEEEDEIEEMRDEKWDPDDAATHTRETAEEDIKMLGAS